MKIEEARIHVDMRSKQGTLRACIKEGCDREPPAPRSEPAAVAFPTNN